MEEIIHTENLTKFYGKIKGIEHVDLSVNRGEIFGFLGPNGAGKTTTIRLLMDLITPTSGTAEIFGLDCQKDSLKIRKRIGYIPGDLSLYDSMSGKKFLQFISSLRPRKPVLTDTLLKRFDVTVNRKIKGFSMGMKQKLGIVQAFMHDPELVIMDEPTLGLDPLMQKEFYTFLKEEQEKGRTFFMSSHILSEVEKVCERVGIIKEGSIVAMEDVDSLRKKSGKVMEVEFVTDITEKDLDIPEITQVSIDGHKAHFRAMGNMDTVIKHVSQYTIKDLTARELSVEDMFMHYYEGE
ncbi:MAG: ABC transporter ATP-binding protein [Candidatus Methanofastidiosia archaeon]|jgi:ABC-2 type transport system ATP-binding protein